VAPSDAAEKNSDMGVQLHSSGVQLPQSYSGKFTSCMTQKHVRSEPFFGLHSRCLTLAVGAM